MKSVVQTIYAQYVEYKKYVTLGVVTALVLIGVLSAYNHFFKKEVPTFKEEYKVVLTDYAGKEVKLSEFKREVLVVFVWASWCPYCGAEIENLARLKEVYGDEVQVVAVNRAEPLADAKNFTDALQKTEGVVFLLDPTDSFFKSIKGYAMPETVFIRPNGEILLHQRGPLKYNEVETRVKQLLGQK